MAQVPYDPVPQGAPGPLPTEGPRVDTPGAAFGTNIGEAIQRGGAQVGQAGNELFQTALQIQNLKNETDARNVAIDTTQKMAMRFAQFDALGDSERAAALPGMLKDLNDLRLKGRAGLNPMAARFYDAEAANLQNSFTRYGALQAGRAVRSAAMQSATDTLDNDLNTAVNINDDAGWDARVAKAKSLAPTIAANSPKGYTKEGEEAIVNDRVGKIRFKQVTELGRLNSPKAMDMLDDPGFKKELGAYYDHAQEVVSAQYLAHGGDSIAKTVWDPKAKLSDLEDRARKIAADPKVSHGLDGFEKTAVLAVQNMYNQEHHAQMMDRVTATHTLDAAINTDKYRTPADLHADPQLDQALQTEPDYDAYGKLARHWAGRDRATSEGIYNNLLGMASSNDPKLRQQFLQADLFVPGLNKGDRAKLLVKREQMIGGNHGLDPQVRSAYQNLVQQYGDAVPKPNAGNRYTEFLGLIHGDLEEWQAKEMPLPTTVEDYKKFGQAIMGRVPGTGWTTYDIGQKEIYRAPVPKDFSAFYKQQGWDDRAISIQYHRTLAAQKFNELFSGGEGGGQ